MNNVLRGFLSIAGGKFIITFLGVVSTPLIVRVIGSSGYGIYAYLLSISAIVTVLARGGISAGLRKYISEERDSDHWKENVFAFYARIGLALVFSVTALLALLVYSGFFESLFEEDTKLLFYLLCILILSDQLFYIGRYTLMGIHHEHLSEPLTVLQKVLFLFIGVGLAYLGYDVAGLLVGTIIGSLAAATCAFYVLSSRLLIRSIITPLTDGFPRKKLLSYNIMNAIFVLLTVSLYNFDILLIQSFTNSNETGYYRAALTIGEFLWMVPMAIQMVYIHSSSNLWSNNRIDEITKMASQATRLTFGFTLLLAIGLFVLAEPFIELYFGNEFGPAVLPLLLLLPGCIGFAIARPIYAIGQGKGELRILILTTGFATILNIILNLALIPIYGIAGAAVATSISYGVMIVLHAATAHRIGFYPLSDFRAIPFLVAGSITLAVLLVVNELLWVDTAGLVIIPPLGFLIYTTLSIRLGGVDISEIQQLTTIFPERIGRVIDWYLRIIS